MSSSTLTRPGKAVGIAGKSQRSRESIALGIGAIAFVVTALLALAIFRLAPTPIEGPGSIGQFAALASAVVAIFAFIAGRYIARSSNRLTILNVIDVGALAFAHAVIAFLSVALFGQLMSLSFIGAPVFGLAGLLLSGAIAAVAAYLCFNSALDMNLSLLALVLATFMVEGVLASALTASDPKWWTSNLSALGMPDDFSGNTFNDTVIIAGILVTTLARYATASLVSVKPQGVRRVRISLIIVGLLLIIVGTFHVDDFFLLHTASASGMAVVFGIMVIVLPWWVPEIPRAFAYLGWLFAAVILLTAIFFATGYYTLTAVELVASVLVFTWIILFLRICDAMAADADAAADKA